MTKLKADNTMLKKLNESYSDQVIEYERNRQVKIDEHLKKIQSER
jgi:hypothetical protein